MSTTTTTPPPSTILLEDISWETYDRLVAEVDGRARLTFDRGRLEIVSPSFEHETWKSRIDKMLCVMVMELGVEIESGGSTTLRRRLEKRGMEPDECYWVQNARRMCHRTSLDLDVDPPPDLVLESEASRSVLDRLSILASLGVPEVWRYDGTRLEVLLLDPHERRYAGSTSSRCCPWLPMAEFAARITRDEDGGLTTWLLGFREWVRQRVVGAAG